ncbi:hypothetical protein BDQ17DRAFT_1328555 [Cyathus striatus]|nr:hypothetical protein BDQ17DRAFT_1328555 [Cyathus striatus]
MGFKNIEALCEIRKQLCAEIPVHLIWGDQDEVMVAGGRALLSNPGPEDTGSSPTLVRYVKDMGHMLVQQKPKLISSAWGIIIVVVILAHTTSAITIGSLTISWHNKPSYKHKGPGCGGECA